MDLKEAIQSRKSIRAFTSAPISREVLSEVLTLGTRAVSAVNRQPWEFVAVAGSPLDRLRDAYLDALHAGVPHEIDDERLSGVYQSRQREIGITLFQSMGIAREDKARRAWWLERGFRFFDAPAVLFVMVDAALARDKAFLDAGAVIQNITLAALALGLGTCVEAQGIAYPDLLCAHLGVPEHKTFVTAIAVGYPDPDFPANHVVSPRVSLSENTSWVGI